MIDDTTTTAQRVSVREIEETTWRAFIAAGASTGEAAAAARAVCCAEIHLGCGISAAVAELDQIPTDHVPYTLSDGIVDVVVDPAGRGLLLGGPIAIGLVVTRPVASPIVLPDVAWHPVIAGLFAAHGYAGEPTVVAVRIGAGGVIGGGAIGTPAGGFGILGCEVVNDWLSAHPRVLAAAFAAAPAGGILISSNLTRLGVPGSPPISHPAERQHERRVQALAEGVRVERATWAPLYEASRRFLVAER